MSSYDQKQPEVRWDKTGFEALKKSWTAARVAQDKKDLTAIFNFAAQVPAAKEALDWGLAHGIDYMVDRQCARVGGYYQGGTGVVALAQSVIDDPVRGAAVLAHETRHAWQDDRGFLWRNPMLDGFSGYFIKMALIEADAYAHETRAQRQGEQIVQLGSTWRLPASYELSNEFLNWFTASGRPGLYGEQASQAIAKMLGVPGATLVDFNVEFKSQLAPLTGTPLNIHSPQGVSRLGEAFSDASNYFVRMPYAKMEALLDKTAADNFYGAANDDQRARVAAIHEKEKQMGGLLKLLGKRL